jgi:hypothetical protein
VSRYLYLGDPYTDPALVGRGCDPIRRDDGKCVVSTRWALALVLFEGEDTPRCVMRRRLRLTGEDGRWLVGWDPTGARNS